MKKISKKLKEAQKLIDSTKTYKIDEAVELVKKASYEKFDSSLRICFNLNVDPKKAEQQLRGTVVLPNGTGKKVKVLAIVEPDDEAVAKKAGATHVGGPELLEKIKNENWFDFDVVVTTPTLMPKFAKYGKLLGTKGLMPNPKLGTVTTRIERTIQDLVKGSIEYRTDVGGNINVMFGKKSFGTKELVENYQEIFNVIRQSRPSTVKGEYIKAVYISSTMGPSVRIIF